MTVMDVPVSLLLSSKLCSFLDNPVIRLETSSTEEVEALKEEIRALQAENEYLRADRKRIEQKYADEVNRNLRLEDICRACGFNWRKYW